MLSCVADPGPTSALHHRWSLGKVSQERELSLVRERRAELPVLWQPLGPAPLNSRIPASLMGSTALAIAAVLMTTDPVW